MCSKRSTRALVAATAAAAMLGGCVAYHARPITRRAVRKRLRQPSWRHLQSLAAKVPHAMLRPVALDARRGLTPDEAALIAVLINPVLRAQRSRLRIGAGQVIQAGLLPNPQLAGNMDFVTGGNTLGTYTAYGIGLTWNTRRLLTRGARLSAARASLQQIDLDVAWREWLVAQAARQSVLDLRAADLELARARRIDARLQRNYQLVKRAVQQGQMTALVLATANSARQISRARVLGLQLQRNNRLLTLRAILGLPPDAPVRLRKNLPLPHHLVLPPERLLLRGIAARRLDLLALRQGYRSAQQRLRAAILAQFPQVNIGFAQGSDNTNVHSAGFGVTIDLPIFDRNQGFIAIDKATRRGLYNSYIARLFAARTAVARAYGNITGLQEQIRAAKVALAVQRRLVSTYALALSRGNIDVFSYYTARINLETQYIVLLRLRRLLADNYIALELAAGEYLPFTPPARRGIAIVRLEHH